MLANDLIAALQALVVSYGNAECKNEFGRATPDPIFKDGVIVIRAIA